MKDPVRDASASESGLGELSETPRAIVSIIKREGSATMHEIAAELGVTYETVRQHVGRMRAEGWVEPRLERPARSGAGRPISRYRLTRAGDHLFPKHYDLLSVELIDALVDQHGKRGLRRVLESLTEARVRRWGPRLEGLTLEQKLRALEGIYLEDDPFTSVEEDADGGLRLVERNCPFLNVASERPALCRLTVSTLTRLLGYRVVREERFQNGDGRCVFRVRPDRVASDSFRFEFEK
jgi:predicted ArsR family transcriptional regulator